MKEGVTYAHAPRAALEQVLALRVHLDDSTATNGPLRVIPETHRDGVFTDSEVQERSSQSKSVECTVAAGGVIAMHPLIIHASSKSATEQPRRVLHIEYSSQLELSNRLRLAIA
jgi:ectoine hydroxylase-related dioxygenase (phytanoyl-CoA dioxygenase family)